MTHSDCSVKDIQHLDNFAKPHTESAGQIVRTPWLDVSVTGPAGSVVSSAEDMAKWIQLQLGLIGQNIICNDTLNDMHTIQMSPIYESAVNPIGYGFGWNVDIYRGRYLYFHAGSLPGYRTRVLLLPEEKIGISIIVNLGCTYHTLLHAAVTRIADILMGYSAPCVSGRMGIFNAGNTIQD